MYLVESERALDNTLILKTTATIERQQRGIATQGLLVSFKDALEVTRVLGVPYFWIDSLCVIQDPETGAD